MRHLRYVVPLLLVFPFALAVNGVGTPKESTVSPEGYTVEIYYGKPLVRSLDAMLGDLRVTLYPEDTMIVFPDPAFGLGGKITITRATPVWIDDGGKKLLVRTFKKTIDELLAEKGFVLGAQDTVTPGADTPLLAEVTVTITRVEETDVVEKRSIPFKTIAKDDSTLFEYSTVTEEEGKNGTKELTYHVRRENGVEVSRVFRGEKVTAESVDKVVRRGTKPLPVYQSGTASWYDHPRVAGFYAAHPTLPFGTKVLVKGGSKSIVVTINDRGPWGPGRVIDLEKVAFQQLAPLGAGLVQVTLSLVP